MTPDEAAIYVNEDNIDVTKQWDEFVTANESFTLSQAVNHLTKCGVQVEERDIIALMVHDNSYVFTEHLKRPTMTPYYVVSLVD